MKAHDGLSNTIKPNHFEPSSPSVVKSSQVATLYGAPLVCVQYDSSTGDAAVRHDDDCERGREGEAYNKFISIHRKLSSVIGDWLTSL